MSVVVVLHEPQDLVNIAHVVRALKNFGFRDLRLVSPREYDAHRIEGIAHQTQDVLARVARYDRLEEALADCVHVVGCTARPRSAKRNLQRPREAAAEILACSEGGPVALLFGREDKGLPNAALDLCHRVVTIPTDPSYASLQLGHAVVLMLYELALARGDAARPFKPPRREAPPAKVDDLQRLFADVEAALEVIEFFKTRQAESVMRTIREIVHRTPLDEREAKLLRAIAIEVSNTVSDSRVPGFTSTGSKRPDALFGGTEPGEDTGLPERMARASGCRVWDAQGREYVDYVMGLGAVALGYGHPDVNRAAEQAIAAGGVGPLPPVLEEELAEALSRRIPWIERGRVFKTGAEAVAAAGALPPRAPRRPEGRGGGCPG